jgi:hypothetical protein
MHAVHFVVKVASFKEEEIKIYLSRLINNINREDTDDSFKFSSVFVCQHGLMTGERTVSFLLL